MGKYSRSHHSLGKITGGSPLEDVWQRYDQDVHHDPYVSISPGTRQYLTNRGKRPSGLARIAPLDLVQDRPSERVRPEEGAGGGERSFQEAIEQAVPRAGSTG